MRFAQFVFLLVTICFSTQVFAQPGTIAPLSVTASNYEPNNPPSKAFDKNDNTFWNAGDAPTPQWIQADLGRNYSISQIRLKVSQFPEGSTIHHIYVGLTVETLRLIGTFDRHTNDGDWLELTNPASNVRYVRIVTVSSPSWVSWREIQIHKGSERGLQYFGYYASAMKGVGEGNYTAAISDHSNVTWIARGTTDEHVAKLQEAAQLNMKAVIDISHVFFNLNPDEPEKVFTLKDNFEAEWNNYANSIAPHICSVVAFYPLDEPFHNGRNNLNLKRDLEIIIATIKERFPDKPAAVIFAYTTVKDSNFVIPSGYDWIGFDCYPQNFPNGNFENCSERPINWYVDTIKAKLEPSQRMIMVPEGLYFGINYMAAYNYQSQLVKRSDQFFTLAQSDPVFIGMFTFIYQSQQTQDERWYGTVALPLVKTKYQQIGRSITNK